jgi:hypothetical protein
VQGGGRWSLGRSLPCRALLVAGCHVQQVGQGCAAHDGARQEGSERLARWTQQHAVKEHRSNHAALTAWSRIQHPHTWCMTHVWLGRAPRPRPRPQARAIKMAIVHDVAESIVGDITPHCKARAPCVCDGGARRGGGAWLGRGLGCVCVRVVRSVPLGYPQLLIRVVSCPVVLTACLGAH